MAHTGRDGTIDRRRMHRSPVFTLPGGDEEYGLGTIQPRGHLDLLLHQPSRYPTAQIPFDIGVADPPTLRPLP